MMNHHRDTGAAKRAGMFKICDTRESTNKGGCFKIYPEPETPNEGASLRNMESPNEGASLRNILNRHRQTRGSVYDR